MLNKCEKGSQRAPETAFGRPDWTSKSSRGHGRLGESLSDSLIQVIMHMSECI